MRCFITTRRDARDGVKCAWWKGKEKNVSEYVDLEKFGRLPLATREQVIGAGLPVPNEIEV